GGYFAELFFCGGGITSLCCAQAPSPNAVMRTVTTMIIFKSFNPSRLLSQQVAPVCLGREPEGSNAFLNFFSPLADRFISSNRLSPRWWSQSLSFERKHQSSKQWPKRPRS